MKEVINFPAIVNRAIKVNDFNKSELLEHYPTINYYHLTLNSPTPRSISDTHLHSSRAVLARDIGILAWWVQPA